MTEEALQPTAENVRKFLMGDEVTAARLRTGMGGEAAAVYNQVVSPANGPIWARWENLGYRTTAFVNLAILASINRPHELLNRIQGLLRGGISVAEIQEVILHVGFYCGNPAGVDATIALQEAMDGFDERGIEYNRTAVDL
jgi:4-carboxymuconolactone decarboxylase